MRHQCSQQALPVLPQSFGLGSLLQQRGCLHCGGPQTVRCLFAGQSGSVIAFPACLALQFSSTAQHHQPISALDKKEPDLLDDDIESHLEIKAALSGCIAWLIAYTTRGGAECLGQRK